MRRFIEVNGHTFEMTDEYESDGAEVTHFVKRALSGSPGALSLHRRDFEKGWVWWLWVDMVAIEVKGFEFPEDALASGLRALTEKRDRLTEILEGWT